MIECTKCGKNEIDEDSKYCPKCGHQLKKEETASFPFNFGSIDKERGILVIVAVLIGLIASLLILPDNSDGTENYLKVQDFTWEDKDPTLRRTVDGSVEASGKLKLETTADNLYVRIYSVSDEKQLIAREKLETEGTHTVESSDHIPKGIEQLELMTCFSKKPNFDLNSRKTECKRNTFSIPRISLNVKPDPAEIDISRPVDRLSKEERVKLTVTNTGELPVKISHPDKTSGIGSNNVRVWFSGYSDIPGRYGGGGGENVISLNLRPEESASFYVNTLVRDDSKKDSYRAKGLVPSLWVSGNSSDALIKERFDVRVNVE